LENDYTVYAMDRRGRGLSGDGEEFDLLREAEDIAAVIDSIGNSVFVIGHSYGALCCLEAALRTENIRKMVLYEPPLPNEDWPDTSETVAKMQELTEDGKLEEALELFFKDVVEMPQEELSEYRKLPVWKKRIELVPTISREMKAASSFTFKPERYADIQATSLLLLGGESPDYFRRAIEDAFTGLPNCMVTVLPDQRHIAMDTAPDLFVETVVDFFKE
jgi:pimeloyl-ACP methyl ester carboxylesterase